MPEDVSNEAVLKWSQILDDIRCELPKCEGNTAAEPCIGPVHELFVATQHLPLLRLQSKADHNPL